MLAPKENLRQSKVPMADILLEYEPDYRAKVLRMGFKEPVTLENKKDVLKWRSSWMQELKSWHSPYKAVVDATKLKVADSEEVKSELEMMLKFFNGLFLRKVAAFGPDSSLKSLPFESFSSEKEASEFLGIREAGPRNASDFRSSIQFENHFQQHVVEMSFLSPQVIDKPEQVQVLKDKLTNNLMQWHSKWSLIIDCTNLNFEPEVFEDFARMEKFFTGFFLKKVIGYSPADKNAMYPFEVFRSRHKAAALLESEGLVSGEDANCQSRK